LIRSIQWANVDLVLGRLAVLSTLQRVSRNSLVVGQLKTMRFQRSIALSLDTISPCTRPISEVDITPQTNYVGTDQQFLSWVYRHHSRRQIATHPRLGGTDRPVGGPQRRPRPMHIQLTVISRLGPRLESYERTSPWTNRV
jgi:hypothetical protein